MRKIVVIAFILFGVAGLAMAQIPTSGNIYFGYAYYNTNLSSIDRANTNGWEATLEGKVLPFIGIIADFSGTYGGQNFAFPCPVGPGPTGLCAVHENVAINNFLFGPRVSVSVGRFRPFAQGVIGVAHVNAHTLATDTSFASGLGGGIDYRLLRVVAWRFQGDYIHTSVFSSHQNNARLSTGIVLRF
jgi:hypothetical protein